MPPGKHAKTTSIRPVLNTVAKTSLTVGNQPTTIRPKV